MTITEAMKTDHHHALVMIERMRDAPEERRRAALDELAASLRQHLGAEHEILYPAMRADAAGDFPWARVDSADEEIRRALESCAHGDGEEAALARLLQALERHRAIVEQELFPQAEKTLGERRLEAMFYESDRRKANQTLNDSLIFPAHRFGR